MDIASIVPTPRVVDIKHPVSGADIGLAITLLPPSAPKIQQVRRQLTNERLQRNAKLTAELLEKQELALIEAAVEGWEWKDDLTFQGTKPEFTPTNLRKVLKTLPWVKEQLDRELGDDAAFFASSGNS